MQNVALVFFALGWVFILWSYFLYDRLAKLSFSEDKQLWHDLGKPRGLLKKISTEESYASNFQESWKLVFLIFKSVDTGRLDTKTKNWLQKFRVIGAIGMICACITLFAAWSM